MHAGDLDGIRARTDAGASSVAAAISKIWIMARAPRTARSSLAGAIWCFNTAPEAGCPTSRQRRSSDVQLARLNARTGWNSDLVKLPVAGHILVCGDDSGATRPCVGDLSCNFARFGP
jgi:hypothetical protein